MKKVIVIGSPGAGKSTFARKLRDKTALPLYYLDLLWHRPDRTNLPEEEFDARLDALIQKDRWIIDGNYRRTLEVRLRACDTVFFLDYPLDTCLSGAEARIGKPREDFPWIEPVFDAAFKQWILDFSKDQLPQIYALLEKYSAGRDIFTFTSREDADTYLNKPDTDRPVDTPMQG